MTTSLPILEILAYSLALWLGLYLIARDVSQPRLRYAGLGLLAYALSLAATTLSAAAPTPALFEAMTRWHESLLFLPALFWLAALFYLWPSASQNLRGVFLVTALFFALGLGLLIFPLAWLPRMWLLIGISIDLILLGLAVAVFDAFDQGEALLPDMFRSFDYAFATACLFGGLVVLAMLGGAGSTFPMIALLLTTITAAMAIQTFADPIQSLVDRLAFAYFPWLQQSRADLRAIASALPRVSPALNFEALDDEEFSRLTRRALSHFGDLPRLATNPLTYLPLIDTRLAARDMPGNTLERAAELKNLLTESITRLKPRDQGDFGTSEAWRYYNALYFPYVLGLKPYSRRSDYHNGLDASTHEALDWFQTYVPERTLHNWQNAAARLVAQDLRERLKQAT